MKHFTITLFEYSNTAKSRGINNTIPDNLKSGIIGLVDNILDPLVEAWGGSIIVSSGFRSDALNRAVGGSTTSAHSFAFAADLVPSNGRIADFKLFTMEWLYNNNILFDQFINEIKNNSEWVHIGWKNNQGQLRRQYMLYKNDTYTSINPVTYKTTSNIQTQTTIELQTTDYGLLQGKSVYYSDSIDYDAVSKNSIYSKGEDGKPVETAINVNGIETKLIEIDDSYLYGADESTADNLLDINDLPKEPDETITKLLEALTGNNIETAKGITINTDGSITSSNMKSAKEIVRLFQQWWELVQTLRLSTQNVTKTTLNKQENNNTTTINALVYIKSAFDKYGHAFREGMSCPICGKTMKYLPPGGYCSVECALKDAKDKAISFLRQPNDKYKDELEIINQIVAILDLTSLIINAIAALPELVKDLVALPQEWKDYVLEKIAEGFSELLVCILELMVKKNKLITKLLKPIKIGVFKKPMLAMAVAIEAINKAIEIANTTFNTMYSAVMVALKPLVLIGGFAINAESFAWAATPRSFISPRPFTSPDLAKIFVNLPGGSGLQTIALTKPLMPSGLETINFSLLDTIISSCFPPLIPTDYYLEPELFAIRFIFSDLSDLVAQIKLQLTDFLSAGPDYIPKFENLLPIKKYTNMTIAGKTFPTIWLPNIGYIWFLLGLLDAWAPHSQALVGSLFNPVL